MALFFQLLDCTFEGFCIPNAPVKALTTQDTQRDLPDLQPTAVLGCGVKRQLPEKASRFCGHESLIQRGRPGRVQGLEDDSHPRSLRECFVDPPLHWARARGPRTLLGHRDVSPSRRRFTQHEHVAHASSRIVVIEALHSPGTGSDRLPGFSNQWCAGLGEADHRTFCLVRFGIYLQHKARQHILCLCGE
jgi:hypothetical protein